MKKQCPQCGKLYRNSKYRCKTCKTDLITAHVDGSGNYDQYINSQPFIESHNEHKYCPRCNEEYYFDVEKCPECDIQLVMDQPFDMPVDESTDPYWKNKDDWQILIIPDVYKDVFDTVRLMRGNSIETLPAFIFNRNGPTPIVADHFDRLETNHSFLMSKNPEQYVALGRDSKIIENPKPPILCVLIQRKDYDDAVKLLQKYELVDI